MFKLASYEQSFIGSRFIFPNTRALRLVRFDVSFVCVSILICKFAFDGQTILESTLEWAIVSIFHNTLPMRFTIFVAVSLVEGVVGSWNPKGLISHA